MTCINDERVQGLLISVQLSGNGHCTAEGVQPWLAEMIGSSWGWGVAGGRKVGVVLDEAGGVGWVPSPGGHTEETG